MTVSAETGRVTPRKSFLAWLSNVRGQSRPWDPWERAAVTEAGHLVTRLLSKDQARRRHELERRTNQLLGERARELERHTAELRHEIEQRTAAQAALQRHRDDLEREVAERTAAAVASEARLADAIEMLPHGFVLYDAEDRLVVCNRAYRALAGMSERHTTPGVIHDEAWSDTSADEAALPDGQQPEQWPRDRLLQRRAVRRRDVRTEFRCADGRWIELHDRRTQDGGLVTTRLDVTEAHRHETILAEQDKLAALGRLAGGVAHEINNLLQPALLFAEVVRDRLPPQDVDSREYLDLVLGGLRKVREIVRNVLLFARKQDPKLETVDFAVEIDGALTFILNLLPKGISLHRHLGSAGVLAAVNRTQLTQVLSNLLLNAIHATGDQGSIEVTLAQSRPSASQAAALQLQAGTEYLTLAVADSGSGMEAATLAHIFEPFFTTKPLGEGTGLGLSVVFGILRGWKGAVAVDSAVGRGTTFTLYVPIVDQGQPSLATA
jgi:signal transduction histidine kinase